MTIKHAKKITAGATIAAALLLTGAGCQSDADKASENISTAAEQFEVQRSIIGVNAITDKPAFEVEGRCSIERDGDRLIVTCKHGEDDYRKHELGLADNVYYASVQLEGIDVSEYHTRIIIKPENIIPEFDLETSAK